MTAPLFLLDPPSPGPLWAPFTGVRPIAELRAGIWKIRERWEAILRRKTTALLADHVEGFAEGDEPDVRKAAPIDGPAIIAASWFAPSGEPLAVGPTVRRLENEGHTVAWIVPAGARWAGPGDTAGESASIDGLELHGTFDLLHALEVLLAPDCADFLREPRDEVPESCIVVGDPAEVVCLGAHVEPGVIFDVRHGAIVLEVDTEIRAGTRLEGPFYAGTASRLMGGDFRGTVIGPYCRVRGEISGSLFLGFSNKAHEGFIGHSVIGQWANLGAGTTTSNLKNTYGEIQLQAGTERIPTGRQFLGSLIGDHAKTAIGSLLNTGTTISTGANLFGPPPVPKYVPPFAWGNTGSERLTEEGFLKIAGRVMPRRGVELTPERRASLIATHRRLAGT
jgi:UDP-N-acetylglucosamine diphosphorylase/glucosamine-1-phosphate N-acetyltransferase